MNDRVNILSKESLSRRWAKLDAYQIAYTRRDGRTETLIREVHDHGHGACVLPYDAGRGTVLLVKQFRLPALLNGLDGDMIEVCAGLLDGIDPAECARREAEEELGFRLSNLRLMTSLMMSPGAITERITLFLADYDLSARLSNGGGHAHEGEDIEVLEMPFDTARHLVRSGAIFDAKSVMLVMFLERELGLPPL